MASLAARQSANAASTHGDMRCALFTPCPGRGRPCAGAGSTTSEAALGLPWPSGEMSPLLHRPLGAQETAEELTGLIQREDCWLVVGKLPVGPSSRRVLSACSVSAEAASRGQIEPWTPDLARSRLARAAEGERQSSLSKDARRSLSKDARPSTEARSVLTDCRCRLQVPDARDPLLDCHVNCWHTITTSATAGSEQPDPKQSLLP